MLDIADKDKEAIIELVQWKRADDAAISSLRQYVSNLMVVAKRADDSLLEISEPDLRDLFISFANGTHPDVKDDGVNLQAYQIAMRCSIENTGRESDHSVLASFLMLFSANRRTISRNCRYQNRERRAESCVRLTVE